MKEWSFKSGGLRWRLTIKQRHLYGKLVGDPSSDLLLLHGGEIRKKPEAETKVDELVSYGAPIVVQAKTRMAKAAAEQTVSSLKRRLRDLKAAQAFIKDGHVDPKPLDPDLSVAMALAMEILETIESIPTE